MGNAVINKSHSGPQLLIKSCQFDYAGERVLDWGRLFDQRFVCFEEMQRGRSLISSMKQGSPK